MCCGKNRELLRQSALAKIDENRIAQGSGAVNPYATTAPRSPVFAVAAADWGREGVFECRIWSKLVRRLVGKLAFLNDIDHAAVALANSTPFSCFPQPQEQR
jgi:hypothetical protein